MSLIPPNREPVSAPYSQTPPNRESVATPYPLTPPNREEPQSTVEYASIPPNREIVDTLVAMQQQTDTIEHKIEKIETSGSGSWVWLQAPATSTSWDGDARSTTAKTKIDLSAVFSIPDYVKAVYVRAMIQDSGASGADCSLLLGPTNSAAVGVGLRCPPADDRYSDATLIVPCDSNGDIYYQISASGSGTMDVHLQIWGYML